ncbi:hypothetical protein PVAP13_8KG297702 [Panicum virgatum]|uniref:Uncharacterized protein n=1 Tax=Panicum virgatum TaxID=38727 RepID=A0A8T0PZ48_PANVG|nr:hypothetical protein PVAP13_8KG297702 [Panicum virgatum]
MATKGKLGITPPRLDCRFLECSTCKITKVGIGGPLVQFDGKFIGMNFYDKKFGTPYVSDTVICKVLEQFNTEGSIAQSGHAGNHGKLVDTKIIGEDYDLPCSWYVPKPYWCDPDVVDKSEAGTGYVSRFMLA